MSSDSVSTTEKKIGNVKWFNNKAGFGFITMGENTDSPKDVFAHYSNINVKNSQYKYLVQGEYVEFNLSPTTEGEHEFQATNITGIQGGATLCERRRMSREGSLEDGEDSPAPLRERVERRPRPEVQSTRARPLSSSGPQRRTRPTRESSGGDDDGFTTVKRRAPRV
jgi:cold shock CspA family protein